MDKVIYNKLIQIDADVNTAISKINQTDTDVNSAITKINQTDTDVNTLITRGTVRNIQSGVCTVTSIPLNISISPVSNMAKSSANLPNIFSDSTYNIQLYATLTTSSNLQINGVLSTGGTSLTIKWEVTEYY